MSTIFETIVGDLSRQESAQMLDDCMTFHPKKTKRIPLRYRILALGFVKKMTVAQVNDTLREAGCDRLYARNFFEATLIYAYAHQLSYEKWRQMLQQFEQDDVHTVDNPYFQGRSIGFKELRDYVNSFSHDENGQILTQQRTRVLEASILEVPDAYEAFYNFMIHNIQEFSAVREKARYYFCKYLYYYMQQCRDHYLNAKKAHLSMEQVMMELMVFKGISDLGRKKLTMEETMALFENASVSCGHVYDAFNQFFFNYVSTDWMEVLLDYYGGDIRKLPEVDKQDLAASLRIYHPKWKKLSDDEIITKKWEEVEKEEAELDRIYAIGSQKGAQRNRSGEKSVRNYIKGVLDIDRTTLITYLMFFGYDLDVPASQQITIDRLNEILTSCLMPELRESSEFDFFVIQYLASDDPVSYLMDTVTDYAFEERNFYLYHMYNESFSYQKQNEEIFGLKKEKS